MDDNTGLVLIVLIVAVYWTISHAITAWRSVQLAKYTGKPPENEVDG